ncbi:MAG: LTA synthase family protein, partial [Nitrospinota bacterium]
LRGEERPVFSLIFTATSHAPYQVPEREKHPFGTEGDLQKYFNCNRYLDAVLADFFKKIPGNPNLENTLFFITGDHTIFPLEKRWETTSLFHLPLFIYGKNHISSGVDKRLGSHMDLFPTLLHAAGYAGPMVNFGRSLLKKGGKNFSVMSQGNTLHATDGEEWLILPHILSPPESFKIQEGYFLKKQQSLCSRELLSLTQSYVQTVHTLFKENRYYP